MNIVKEKVNIFVALWRLMRLGLHFGWGAIRVFLFVRHYEDAKKAQVLQIWSKQLMQLLGIRLCIEGEVPKQLANTLIVSNHISWLDILVVFTVIKPRFVAKKEIGDWPIIGKLTKAGNTVFINRASKRHIMQVNEQLSQELLAGHCIAVFPEGTTSEGYSVLPFKASLFEPIFETEGKVLPLTIQYLNNQGYINTRPTFTGDTTLLKSVWNVLTCYQLTIKVVFGQCIESKSYSTRNELANVAYQAVLLPIEYKS